jgi:hypothetical protein
MWGWGEPQPFVPELQQLDGDAGQAKRTAIERIHSSLLVERP